MRKPGVTEDAGPTGQALHRQLPAIHLRYPPRSAESISLSRNATTRLPVCGRSALAASDLTGELLPSSRGVVWSHANHWSSLAEPTLTPGLPSRWSPSPLARSAACGRLSNKRSIAGIPPIGRRASINTSGHGGSEPRASSLPAYTPRAMNLSRLGFSRALCAAAQLAVKNLESDPPGPIASRIGFRHRGQRPS